MKIIYCDKTQKLMDQVNEAIVERTNSIINKMSKKGYTSLAVRDEMQSDRQLNLMRNELVRLHQISIPVGYEFEKRQVLK